MTNIWSTYDQHMTKIWSTYHQHMINTSWRSRDPLARSKMSSLAILSAAAKSSTLLRSWKTTRISQKKSSIERFHRHRLAFICPRYCFSDNRYFLRLDTTIPMPQDSLDFYQTWTPVEIIPVTMEAMKDATEASKPKIADTAVAIGPLILLRSEKKDWDDRLRSSDD